MTPEELGLLEDLWNRLQCVDSWQTQINSPDAWSTSIGSEIESDNELAHPLAVSTAAGAAIGAAISQLGALRDSLFRLEIPAGATLTTPVKLVSRVHVYGHYGMIRCALENASMGYWLLESPESAERIHRLVRADLEEVRQADEVRKLLGQAPKTPMNQRQAAMRELLATVGADGRTLKSKSYSDIVKDVGTILEPNNPTQHLALWKVCSSLAHGETRGMIAYLDREAIGSPTTGTTLHQITANIPLIHRGTATAIATTRTAFHMFALRAGVPPPP